MIKKLLLVFIVVFLNANESDMVKKHCKGAIEYTLQDKTRVDCLTDTHAIEYDYANKWAEAIGQSLYYAHETGKKPGIVLIFKPDSNINQFFRAEKLAKKYNIQIQTVKENIDYCSKLRQKHYDLLKNIELDLRLKDMDSYYKNYLKLKKQPKKAKRVCRKYVSDKIKRNVDIAEMVHLKLFGDWKDK